MEIKWLGQGSVGFFFSSVLEAFLPPPSLLAARTFLSDSLPRPTADISCEGIQRCTLQYTTRYPKPYVGFSWKPWCTESRITWMLVFVAVCLKVDGVCYCKAWGTLLYIQHAWLLQSRMTRIPSPMPCLVARQRWRFLSVLCIFLYNCPSYSADWPTC